MRYDRVGKCLRAPVALVLELEGLGNREIISFISTAKTNLGAYLGDQTGQLSTAPLPTY